MITVHFYQRLDKLQRRFLKLRLHCACSDSDILGAASVFGRSFLESEVFFQVVAAEQNGLAAISLDTRDCDIPLSARGVAQARALGDWFGGITVGEQPTVVLCSPYIRSQRTAEIIWEQPAFESHPRCSVEFTMTEVVELSGASPLHWGTAELSPANPA